MTKPFTIDDIQAELGNLCLLLSAEKDYLLECDFGPVGNRNHDLEKASALNSIAENHARQLLAAIDSNYASLRTN